MRPQHGQNIVDLRNLIPANRVRNSGLRFDNVITLPVRPALNATQRIVIVAVISGGNLIRR